MAKFSWIPAHSIENIMGKYKDVRSKSLKEPIARRANKESNKKGHFWDSRFKSIILIGAGPVILCQTFIDLNPIRAGIADTPENSKYTRAFERIQANEAVKKNSRNKRTRSKRPCHSRR